MQLNPTFLKTLPVLLADILCLRFGLDVIVELAQCEATPQFSSRGTALLPMFLTFLLFLSL